MTERRRNTNPTPADIARARNAASVDNRSRNPLLPFVLGGALLGTGVAGGAMLMDATRSNGTDNRTSTVVILATPKTSEAGAAPTVAPTPEVTAAPTAAPTPEVTPAAPTAAPTPEVTAAPTAAPTPEVTPAAPTAAPTPEVTPAAATEIKSINGVPLKEGVVLPETWPTSREQAVAAFGGDVNPDFVMPGYETGSDGSTVWNGTWQMEAFPLKNGVKFEDGNYVDANGKKLLNAGDVYDFSKKPLWTKVKLSTGMAYIFWRTGGLTPSDYSGYANTSVFDGTQGTESQPVVEQAALIPTSECTPDTAAWRDAVKNATWNKDVQKGNVTIEWYNPEKGAFEVLDLRTISAYAEAGINMSIIDELPMGYPLTPEEAAKATGGTTEASKWYLDPNTGNWNYEGFGLMPGVVYDKDHGVFRNYRGNVLTNPTKIFDFSKYNPDKWPDSFRAANTADTYTFIRNHDTSNYAFKGQLVLVINGEPGIEQASIIAVRQPGNACLTIDAANTAMVADATAQANSLTKQDVTGYTLKYFDEYGVEHILYQK